MSGLRIGSAGAFLGSAVGGDTRSGIKNKLNELKNQREVLEKALTENRSDRTLQNKLRGIDNRIETLDDRLRKLEEANGKCQTCENRKYQDGSDDPGVSFKSAAKIAPEAAASAVRGHEMEHVYRNQAKAEREGRKIVSQSVRIKTAICPECGKPFVSGGETRTVTKPKTDKRFDVGLDDGGSGRQFDAVA